MSPGVKSVVRGVARLNQIDGYWTSLRWANTAATEVVYCAYSNFDSDHDHWHFSRRLILEDRERWVADREKERKKEVGGWRSAEELVMGFGCGS